MTQSDQELIEHRVRLDPDGGVTAFSGKVDFGQGIRVAFGQIVAEELDLPFERVRVLLADTALVPFDVGTFGSQSIHADGAILRRAAAAAREMLIARACARLGVEASEVETLDGTVRIKGDGRMMTYEQLAADGPLSGVVPPDVPIRRSRALRVVGRSLRSLEASEVVTGRATYVADVRLPGMLRGAVLRPPAKGARLTELDEAVARATAGVVAIVRDGDFVGVVTERQGQATAALAALRADWAPVEPAEPRSIDVTLRRDEGIEAALAAAAKRVEAAYSLAYISNAPIGPSAAVADVRDDGATIYSGTQRPFGIRAQVAQYLGLPQDKVRVIVCRSSGTYGRNNDDDAPLEAVRLSRAVKRPVLVQWTREEEFALGSNRPAAYIETTGALSGDGRIVAWRYQVSTNAHSFQTFQGIEIAQRAAFTAGSGAVPSYDIPRAEITLHVEEAPLRTAAFRSLSGAENVFAVESLVDELAALAGEDPIGFRLRHITDPRLRAVLELAADRSGWSSRPEGEGRGFGVACTVFHETPIAQVAEVSVDGRGQVRLLRMWCAVDPGLVINPDGVRGQIEGAMQQAASLTLMEDVKHRSGRVTTTGWDTYRIATFQDAPESVDVLVAGDDRFEPTGVGEAGTVPVSAAIANAVFAATGARCRDLPLSRENVRKARAAISPSNGGTQAVTSR